jgi:hypothetical protein
MEKRLWQRRATGVKSNLDALPEHNAQRRSRTGKDHQHYQNNDNNDYNDTNNYSSTFPTDLASLGKLLTALLYVSNGVLHIVSNDVNHLILVRHKITKIDKELMKFTELILELYDIAMRLADFGVDALERVLL